MVVFTAGGQMLGTGGGYTAEPNIKMLKDALRKYKPEEAVAIIREKSKDVVIG